MTQPPRHIRVLHSFDSLNQGGIETWLMNVMRQKPPGVQFDFALERPGGFYEEEAKSYGSQIYYYPLRSRLRKRLQVIGLAKRSTFLRDLLTLNRYDAFHVHGEEFLGDAVKEAHAAGVPVRVAHCHGAALARGKRGLEMMIRSLRFRTLDRARILRFATDIVACSNEAGSFLAGRYWNTDPRCRPLYCGIPLDEYLAASQRTSRSEFRRRKGIPEDAIVIGHVGTMGPTPVKNHAFLLDVFHELARHDSRYYLYLAGDGPLRPQIALAVKDRGLESRVMMPGRCSDVPDLMVHAFDVLVFPSLREGLGLVIVEAIAAGLYAVCSDVIPCEVTRDISGRVTPLSLESPVATWADHIQSAVLKRVSPADGIAVVQESPFSIRSSLHNLLRLYGDGVRSATMQPSSLPST